MNMYSVNLEAMGKRIRGLRATQKKTQEVFAEMIHISTSYLALIEGGKRTASLDIVAQIAKSCHVSVDYLLFGEGMEISDMNQKKFEALCRQYTPQEVSHALDLSEYYLSIEKNR